MSLKNSLSLRILVRIHEQAQDCPQLLACGVCERVMSAESSLLNVTRNLALKGSLGVLS